MWWRRLAEVQTEHQNGEERGFKWLNVEWLLVSDGLVWVFQKLLIYWDFHVHTISRVYREWSEKEKISIEWQLCGQKCLIDVRGEWADWLYMIERQQFWSNWTVFWKFFSRWLITPDCSSLHSSALLLNLTWLQVYFSKFQWSVHYKIHYQTENVYWVPRCVLYWNKCCFKWKEFNSISSGTKQQGLCEQVFSNKSNKSLQINCL